MFSYISSPDEIYQKSFSMIRKITDFGNLTQSEVEVAVRLIHACGMPEIVQNLRFSPNAINAGKEALKSGKQIFVDSKMVKAGIIRKNLKYGNPITCSLNKIRSKNKVLTNPQGREVTRSAMAVELWKDDLAGCIVIIGNAPTALFRLLEMINSGCPLPSLILGFPVGFVGAAESKEALTISSCGVPYITLLGRRGGSAIAAASINAISSQTK